MASLKQKIVSTIGALSLTAGLLLTGVGGGVVGGASGAGGGVVGGGPVSGEPAAHKFFAYHYDDATNPGSQGWGRASWDHAWQNIRAGLPSRLPPSPGGDGYNSPDQVIYQACNTAMVNAAQRFNGGSDINDARVVAVYFSYGETRSYWNTWGSTTALFSQHMQQNMQAGQQFLYNYTPADIELFMRGYNEAYSGIQSLPTNARAACVALNKNEPMPSGSLKIQKKDGKTGSSGAIMQGAQYTLSGPNGESQTLTIGADGTTSAADLKPGAWTLQETLAPVGYRLDPTSHSVTITAGQETSYGIGGELTDVKHETAKIQIAKKVTDTNTIPFPGTVDGIELKIVADSLTVSDPGEPIWTKAGSSTSVTVNDGLALSPPLIDGTYTITETSVGSTNTALGDGHIKIQVSEGIATVTENTSEAAANTNVNNAWNALNVGGYDAPTVGTDGEDLTFNNAPLFGLAKIVKLDDKTGQGLDGAVFTVSNEAGYSRDYTSNAEGIIYTEPLPVGTYSVYEKTPPIPYMYADPRTQTVEVTAMQSPEQALTVTFENHEQLFNFTVEKKSLTKAGMGEATLEGAEFEVSVVSLVREGINGQKQPGEVVGTFSTDGNGSFSLTDMPLGKYKIVETKAPEGFALNKNELYVEARYDDPSKSHSDLISWENGENKTSLDAEVAKKHSQLKNVFVGLYADGDDTVENPGKFDENSVFTVPNTDVAPVDGATGHYYDKVKLGRIQLNKHQEDSQDIASGEKPIEADIDFAIIDAQGNTVQTITTTVDGNAATGWLPYGVYTLRQLTVPMSDGSRLAVGAEAPEGVNAVSTPIKDQIIDLKAPLVEADWLKVSFDYENALNFMRLRMVKTDQDTGKNILQSGIEFQLYKQDGTLVKMVQYGSPTVVVDRFTIDEDGYTDTFQKLTPGTYYLHEVNGPKGYTYDPEKKFEFVIPDGVTNNDQAVVITVDLGIISEDMVEHSVANQPQYGKLTINKTGDQFTEWTDAEVEVNQQEDATVDTRVTSKAQSNVALKLVGVVPNPDYKKDIDPASFASKNVTETVSTDDKGAFEREVGEGEWTLLQGKNKLATLTVKAGKTDTIKAQLPNVEKSEDHWVPGEINKKSYTVKKPVYKNAPLAGAKFEVKAAEDVMSYDGQTKIYSEGDTILFATEDIVADKDIYNESGRHLLFKQGDVVYSKGDAISFPEVAHTDEQVSNTVVSVDTEEGLTLSRLPLGKYSVTETEAPLGWKVGEDAQRTLTFSPQAFDIAFDSQAVAVDNPRQILTITLDKKELEQHPYFDNRSVENTVFGLYTKSEVLGLEADTLVGVQNPNAEGVITFTDLPEGDFYIKEISTLNGYVLDNADYDTAVTHVLGNEDQVTVLNQPVKNNVDKNRVHIAKVDAATGKTIKGAVFELFAIEGDKEVPVINPETGKNEWSGNTDYTLPVGHYKAVEKQAPMGYVGEGTVVQIANTGDTLTEVHVSNNATEIAIYKLDKDTGLPITGAGLALFDMSGNLVMLNEDGMYDPEGTVEARWVSTETPFVIKGLPVNQQFSLVETGTPEGYVDNGEPTVFTVGALIGEQTISRTNEMTELHILKTDTLTGEALKGATLGVFEVGADDPVVNPVTGEPLVWTTGEQPKAVYGLHVGATYEIRELETPAGYVPPTVPYKVFIGNVVDAQEAVITNLPTEVKVAKVDAKSGKPLAGATLQIFDVEAGQVATDPLTGEVLQWESTEEAKTVHRLPIGKAYELREVASPDARYGIADPIPFTIGDKGVVSLTMENAFTPVSFGDKIWFDANGDGKQNDNEKIECNCLAKTKIYLLVDDGNGNPVKVSRETINDYAATADGVKGLKGAGIMFDEDGLAYTVADCDGNYAFTNLISGKYGKEVHLSPECDLTFTTPKQGGNCEDSDVYPTDDPRIGRTELFDITPHGSRCVPPTPPTCDDDPFLKDGNGNYILDANGNKVANPNCSKDIPSTCDDPYVKDANGNYVLDKDGNKIHNPNCSQGGDACENNPFDLDNPCIDTGLVKISKGVPPTPKPPVLAKTGVVESSSMILGGAFLMMAGLGALVYSRRRSDLA